MTQVIAIAKSGVNVLTATDPNDFIFHSEYNTFKIVANRTTDFSLTSAGGIQEFTVAHGLAYTPLAYGFCRFDSGSEVLANNNLWIPFFSNQRYFNSVAADATNVIFRFTNNSGVATTAHVRYFLFEVPL